MKKFYRPLSILLSLFMLSLFWVVPLSVSALEKPQPKAGVTVYKDSDSPTGYSVLFGFKDDNATKVEVEGEFTFYRPSEGHGKKYEPHQWTPDMYPQASAIKIPLAKDSTSGLWTVTIPLPSDAYRYWYMVDNVRTIDPVNPPFINPNENGGKDHQSVVRVPFDPERQIIDNSLIMPRTDGKSGTTSWDSFEDINGTTRPIGIYLPYKYDVNREKPYKVLYLFHGGNGNEVEWMYMESAPYVIDNLTAEGKLEDTILVSMNQTVYNNNMDNIAENMVKHLIPTVEEKYNASTESKDRAIAGVSMGCVRSSYVYHQYPEMFGYWGIFSGSMGYYDMKAYDQYENLDNATIFIGAGKYDFAYTADMANNMVGFPETSFSVNRMTSIFDKLGVDYSFYLTPHGHDMFNNTRLFSIFASEVLWKEKDEVGSDIKEGATVNRDLNSPTGYSVTFGYKEKIDGHLEKKDEVALVTKVEVKGDFTFYDPAKGNETTYTPFEWQKDMFSIGGDLKIPMTKSTPSGMWSVTVPLPNDIYRYSFYVNDKQVIDPANPPLNNPNVNGGTDPSSVIHVPFDSERQSVDNSIIMPRTDDKKGTTSWDSYTDINGDTRPLGVYLPYGYDVQRKEAYKVLYMFHGGAGNEVEWMYLESAPNVLDNLIASGKLQDTILISMNQTVYGTDYEKVADNLANNLIPAVEKKYNVSKESKDRAIAGVSAGSVRSSYCYYKYAEMFGYWGIFSGSLTYLDIDEYKKFENLDNAKVFIGAGKYDFAYTQKLPNRGVVPESIFNVNEMMATFDKLGIEYDFYLTPHAHDMFNNTRLFSYFAEEVLWSNERIGDGDGNGDGDSNGENKPPVPKPETGEQNNVGALIFIAFISLGVIFISGRIIKKRSV